MIDNTSQTDAKKEKSICCSIRSTIPIIILILCVGVAFRQSTNAPYEPQVYALVVEEKVLLSKIARILKLVEFVGLTDGRKAPLLLDVAINAVQSGATFSKDDIAPLVEELLDHFIRNDRYELVLRAFRLKIELQPELPEAHLFLAGYLMGFGELKESRIQQQIFGDLIHLREQNESHELPPDDNFEEVSNSSVIFFTSSWDEMVHMIMRTMFSKGEFPPVWNNLVAHFRVNCGVDLNTYHPAVVNSVIRVREIVDLVSTCTLHQHVLEDMIAEGRSIESKNSFGWTGLHHAAYIGSAPLVSRLLELGASVSATNVFGQTPFHVAVMRGHAESLKALLDWPETDKNILEVADIFERTVKDTACIVGTYARDALEKVLNQTLLCPEYSEIVPDADANSDVGDGGWGEVGANTIPIDSTRCDIAQRRNLSAEDFLKDFLSLSRPVIIRSATFPVPHEQILNWWNMENFVSKFGHRTVNVGPIPYSYTFGLPSSEITISNFVEYLRTQKGTNPLTTTEQPDYIFIEIGEYPEMNEGIFYPYALDPEKTEILPSMGSQSQIYVGGPGTGAPVHLHEHAYNYIVYGQKVWTLLPHPAAVYSRRRGVVDWEEIPRSERMVMTCVQNAGDAIYVPEGWGHGVLNTKLSVGWATPFAWGAMEW